MVANTEPNFQKGITADIAVPATITLEVEIDNRDNLGEGCSAVVNLYYMKDENGGRCISTIGSF